MPKTVISDDEIVTMWLAGTPNSGIPAGRDRITRVLRERNVGDRKFAARQYRKQAGTSPKHEWEDALRAIALQADTLPRDVPRYRGGSLLRDRLNQRRIQEART